MKAPPTLQTIAALAGVSRTAVSLALRKHRSIPEKTRARIARIAAKVGYKTDPVVTTLMARLRVKRPVDYRASLAWLTSWPSRNGWRSWLVNNRCWDGAFRRAAESGYHLEEFWLTEPGLTSRRASAILKARGIEGVIVADPPKARTRLGLDWKSFSVAVVGHNLQHPSFHQASNDYFGNMYHALEQIHRLGYRRPGLVLSVPADAGVYHAWSGAFLAYHEASGVVCAPALLRLPQIKEAVFQRWFAEYRPDCIIDNEFEIAAWLGKLPHKAGETVPGHIRLDCVPSTFDFARIGWTEARKDFSGINQQAELVGAAAVDLVISQLHRNEHGIPAAPKRVLLSGCWVKGQTLDRRVPRKSTSSKANLQPPPSLIDLAKPK